MESDSSHLDVTTLSTTKEESVSDEEEEDDSFEEEDPGNRKFMKDKVEKTNQNDRDELQMKYDKLKRIYLKLKQKYKMKEKQRKSETSSKGFEANTEVFIIKEEPEDEAWAQSGADMKEKVRLAKTPRTRKSTRRSTSSGNESSNLRPSCFAIKTDNFNSINESKKRGRCRRKSSKPRKNEEKLGAGRCESTNVSNLQAESYVPLDNDDEDFYNNKKKCFSEDVDCHFGDSDTESKKQKKKLGSKVKLKERRKSSNGKEAKIFRCERCGKFLSSRPILEKHYRIHTGERPYQCHICGKSFNSLSSFNNHTRIHNGIKPYKCRHCDKCFTETSQRTTHERTHTGEKPYMCDLCGGRFSLRSSLVRHRRIHTGEKPYVCQDCGAAYCQYTQLSHHKKKCTWSHPVAMPLCCENDVIKLPAANSNEDNLSGSRSFQEPMSRSFQNSMADSSSFHGSCSKRMASPLTKDLEKKSVFCQGNFNKTPDPANHSGDLGCKSVKNPNAYDEISATMKREASQENESCLSRKIISSQNEMTPGFTEIPPNLLSNVQPLQHVQPSINPADSPRFPFPPLGVTTNESLEGYTPLHTSWFVNNLQSS